MSEILTIRPYARLITMLGDQLIKNERIALIELIKNAYDADADWVKVSFVNFDKNFAVRDDSKIIIEDNGNGMNREIIEKHWLNPATPEKANRKRLKKSTDKGRIIQGEKGIGRFAIFKLGQKIEICTRRRLQGQDGHFIDDAESVENIVTYDFSQYDEDFRSQGKDDEELFIDQLQVEYEQRLPSRIVQKEIKLGELKKPRNPYGTVIEISSLKTKWTNYRVDQIQSEIGKLQSIFAEDGSEEFRVWIYRDDNLYNDSEDYKKGLQECLNNKAVFKITNGRYLEEQRTFEFDINNIRKKMEFSDLAGLDAFKNYFCDAEGNTDVFYKTECGDFQFQFYIFDFVATDEKYILSEDESKLIKSHRVYLYRDRIRVLPYGDADDDWLKIDTMRGTKSAGYYLSNDQVVGCIDISQDKNPRLRDKTNREGLIDDGRALGDFINLLQVLLRYFRKIEYQKYQIDKRKRQEIKSSKSGKPLEQIQALRNNETIDSKTEKRLDLLEKSYRNEKQVYEERIRRTENLAAVGLSVETASHDVMIVLKKVVDQISQTIADLKLDGEVDKQSLLNSMEFLRDNINLVYTQMKDIRLLFPAAKQKAVNVSLRDILAKVQRLYMRAMENSQIEVEIIFLNGDLMIKATEAVLLQVFVNLFDNALYWLKTIETNRAIKVIVDRDNGQVIFSDNGPGVKKESAPYIFEAFYSEKGKDGRGLGLYIARQLLDRYDYEIVLLENDKMKILPGANFCLTDKGE